jgi:hypothetical protein
MPFDLLLTTPAGQPTQTLTVPTQWRDVSLAQYVALYAPEPDDQRSRADVLCGLEAGGFNNLAVQDVPFISNLLEFSLDPSDVLELLPTPGLPDIASLPFGTLLAAQQYVESLPDRQPIAYGPYLLALYRTQMTWGKYSEAKVEACLAMLLASPCTEVAADASFFLKAYQRSLKITHLTPRTLPTPTITKRRQAMSGFQNASARCSAWIRRLGGLS